MLVLVFGLVWVFGVGFGFGFGFVLFCFVLYVCFFAWDDAYV